MPEPPSGTVTFLFTDIEGSTTRWEHQPALMQAAFAQQEAILRRAIAAHGGYAYKMIGDAFQAAFATAPAALAAALDAQRALHAEWPGDSGQGTDERSGVGDQGSDDENSKLKTQNLELGLRVRMALHTGITEVRADDYVGPLLNRVARLLAAGHGGQVLLSEVTCGLVRDELAGGVRLRDLGKHRLKDLIRPEHIYQVIAPDLPADFPPLRTLNVLPNNLPLQLTSFIRREREEAAIKGLLTTTHLLTLTGPGGTGKTRLSLHVAADLLDRFPDGVWLAELAALTDPALVPRAVAGVLGVAEEVSRPLLSTLTDHLRDKTSLLLLDNCEHLVDACARLAEALLRACPGLRILASSREALGVGGEALFRVPSLSLPDVQHLPPLASLSQYEAVRLFIDRGVAVQPRFAVTNANAPAVAQICARLDGIPLAIELAAARVKALPVEQIATRLDDRFRLLTGGSRTALPRQQTLHALIDWSWDLLTDGEQRLWARLAVFSGGWTMEAAEAVCAGDGLDAGDVLDLLTRLVDKSLVVLDESAGGGRYQMLETIRQYGREKLLAGETDAARTRHVAWCRELAEQAEPHLVAPEQLAWLDRLEAENDNLRAALAWALERAPDTALALGAALHQFWEIRGYLTEGRSWLEAALAQGAGVREVRARALLALGRLAITQGDAAAAQTAYEESAAVWRDLGDARYLSLALTGLGHLAMNRGDRPAARHLYEEALALRRQVGDPALLVRALHNLAGPLRGAGDYAGARALYEESAPLARRSGDRRGLASVQAGLAWAAADHGDFALAATLMAEAMRLFEELGDKWNIALSLLDLAFFTLQQGDAVLATRHYRAAQVLAQELEVGYLQSPALAGLAGVARLEGNFPRAVALLEESLALARRDNASGDVIEPLNRLGRVLAQDLGDPARAAGLLQESLVLARQQDDVQLLILGLDALAGLAAVQGRPAQAARLFSAAEARRAAQEVPFWPLDRAERDRTLAAARAQLAPAAWDAAWAEGATLPLDALVATSIPSPERA